MNTLRAALTSVGPLGFQKSNIKRILKMRKQHRDVENLAKGHTVSWRKGQNRNSGLPIIILSSKPPGPQLTSCHLGGGGPGAGQ